MKMRFYHNNGKLIAGFLVLFLFTISCSVKAQLKEMNPLSKIKIEIQNTKKGVTLKAMEGCAWSVLGFNLTEGQSQNIDNFGMVGQNDPLAVNTSSHSDFLITITKTREGFRLDGIKGTSWVALTFRLAVGKKSTFDDTGVWSED